MEAVASFGKGQSYKKHIFNVQLYLASPDVARKVDECRRSEKAYSQGDPATNVPNIQAGRIELSVINGVGKAAVVAMLGRGDFCGEECLAGRAARAGTATAIAPTTVLVIKKQEVIRVLHADHAFSDLFVSYIRMCPRPEPCDLVQE
jgi:CRP/FNR family cyclic AMP-dependent transcriptional regulator